MRKLVDKNKYKHLFDLDDEQITAENYLNTHKPQEVVDESNLENEDVWKGIKALLDSDYSWKSYIIEGVAILPKLVSSYRNNNLDIKSIFIIDQNQDWTNKVIYSRGLWDDAEKYSDDVKPKELEWVSKYNEYLISECVRYNLKLYKITNRETFLNEIKDEIKKWID